VSSALRWYVASLFLALFAGVLLAVTAVFLAVDYTDQQRLLAELSNAELLRLYLARSVLALKQLAPAAMLLAGGSTVAIIRSRGEWVGLQSLGVSPTQALGPLALACLGLWAALVAFDEGVATRATARASTFRQAAWQSNGMGPAAAPRWFALKNVRLQCRGGREGTALNDVTLWWLSPSFSVEKRIDARRLVPGATRGEWVAHNVTAYLYDGEKPLSVQQVATMSVQLDERASDAAEVTGQRPEALSFRDLAMQQEVRQRLGLPIEPLALTAHLRLAYPATGVAAALLSALLALRRPRGQLTHVLVSGVAVCFVLVVLLSASRTLVLSGRAPPGLAAWAPVVLLVAAIAVLWQALQTRR
jgi:lipopolysaccharide export LptBFGC system permease protein LptF